MILQLVAVVATALLPASTWGLDQIDASSAGTTGSAVDIYIIDSGVAPHPELAGRLEPGIDLVDGVGDGTTDCNGHGTHVAGIAAGSSTGVAPGATIVPVRILDCEGSGTSNALDTAARWIVDHHRDGEPAVANLSLIGPASDGLDTAARLMIDDGITVIVAAGNLGIDACTLSPARVPEVITVAASDQNDRRPSWSNNGPCVDVHAPGDRITSLAPNGGTSLRSGTSIASPHVAGAAALILAGDPLASPADIAATILNNAIDVVADDGSGTTGLRLLVNAVAVPATTIVNEVATSAPTVRHANLSTATRRLDTRIGVGGVEPEPLGTGQVIVLPLVDPGRSTGAAAVLTTTVTQTITGPTGGYLTLEPCSTDNSATRNISTLNFLGGQTVANTAIVPVSDAGTVCIRTVGSAHLIVDFQRVLTARDDFHPVEPFRRVGTRIGIGGVPARPITEGEELRIPITGQDGIPASGVTAISANLTVTDTVAPPNGGYIRVRPCGFERGEVSNLNFSTGETVANALISTVGPRGAICITVRGTAHILIDINGWIGDHDGISTVTPTRLIDTRLTIGTVGSADGSASIVMLDLGASAAIPHGATAAIVNLTVTDTSTPSTGGFASAHPCGTPATGSNLNFTNSDQVAVTLFAPLTTDGITCLTVVGQTALVIDLAGYVDFDEA